MSDRVGYLWTTAALLVGLTACASPGPKVAPQKPAVAIIEEPPGAEGETEQVESDDGPIRIAVDVDDPERWLSVESVRDGAAGAWATGDFDADRNKLDIRTRDVERFAVDTGRVAIDWERPVILGINGRNSELRRRDFRVYHFVRDDHGSWIVLEP